MNISEVILSSNYGLPHPLNAQTIFDKCALHLIHQGRRSVDSHGIRCAYRGQNGAACAVGALIPDERYKNQMEGRIVDALWLQFMPELQPFQCILSDLQALHDHICRVDGSAFGSSEIDLRRLTNGLRQIASDHGLSICVLDASAAPALPAELTSLLRNTVEA